MEHNQQTTYPSGLYTPFFCTPSLWGNLFLSETIVDGVLVAKKDFNAPKHDEIDVPNLQVIKALQSLDSKQYVKTQFSWQYYYYTLTDEGIEYLREYLHLPSEIFPATFKKTVRTGAPRRAGKNICALIILYSL